MLGNISQLLEMKKKADEIKAKLETIQVTETSHGITVDCNGNRKILSIHISAEQLENKTALEENLCDVINQCLNKAEKAAAMDMAGMAGGLSGLFNK